MRKLYTTLLACLCAAATAFAAENVYTLKLVTMMQAVAGEYQQEITFDQANTTYTFVDFLGSGCNFTVKIEPQEGVSLDDISKYKYIKPDDGTTAITIFGDAGFSVNGFADKWSKALTLDGKDALQVKNPEFSLMNGYSYADYPDKNNHGILEFTMFVQAAAKEFKDDAWTEEKAGQMYNLKVEVPFGLPDSGLDDIEIENNAPVEYFNLQGMPVSNPATGQPVIRRQGSKTSKVIIR